jgi:signal transduction histidine kinase/BarA-like signal transduction histidine kinase
MGQHNVNHEAATILIIDDTPANLDLLYSILIADHYQVRALPDGYMALRAIRAEPPDLILLDIKMPKIDGYGVCKELKADPQTCDIPIIFISALQETADKIRAFEVGGVDYVSKPFQPAEVLARVRTHLSLRQAQQALIEAKDRAEAANRAKSTFLANMSHELRSPLHTILGFAQLLAQDPEIPEEQRESARYIRQGGESLLSLLNDLLDLAKIEAGHSICYPENWNTTSFFNEIYDLFQFNATQKGLTFTYDADGRLPSILHADPRRLRQILINLLGNAVKFTNDGTIKLRTYYAAPNLTIEVHDTGSGIPSTMLKTIFEPFQQAGSADQKIQGTGLGLSITRKLIDMMNGTLTVTSTEGVGSCFTVQIPAQAIHADQDLYNQEQTAQGTVIGYSVTDETSPESLCILVVDEVEVSCHLLCQMLTTLGFETITAQDAATAVAIGRQQPIAAMILDLAVSKTQNFEVLHQQYRTAEYKNIPIIALSADAFQETCDRIIGAGFDAVLTKPLAYAQLLTTLAEMLPIIWRYDG